MSAILFLKTKLQQYNIFKLIRLELEAWILGIVSYVPGMCGFLIRRLVSQLFFRRLVGMQWIQPGVIFVHANNISLGSNVGINSNSYINGVGEIEIEDFVLIGNNVTISSGKHPIVGKYPTVFERVSIPSKIKICKGAWIGAGAVIMPGITLGEGSVIGANAVVTKDTEPFSINVGTPARMIGKR